MQTNIRTWIFIASLCLAFLDLGMYVPTIKDRDLFGKVIVILQITCNWIVLGLSFFSYWMKTIAPIRMALNLAQLRYHLSPWNIPGDEIGQNHEARYLMRMVGTIMIINWQVQLKCQILIEPKQKIAYCVVNLILLLSSLIINSFDFNTINTADKVQIMSILILITAYGTMFAFINRNLE